MMKISEQLKKLVVSKMLDGCCQFNVAKDLKIHQTIFPKIFDDG